MRLGLKLFRIEQGLNQSEMAEHFGVARLTYGAIERGERGTSEKKWEKFKNDFNIPDEKMWTYIKNTEG